jgi:transcriptional regulator with XRE-family HTH domain
MIAHNIRLLRQHFDMRQEDFAAQLKISRSFLSQVESGRYPPSELLIEQIMFKFNVNREWLEKGRGEMFQEARDERTELKGINETPANYISTVNVAVPRELEGNIRTMLEILTSDNKILKDALVNDLRAFKEALNGVVKTEELKRRIEALEEKVNPMDPAAGAKET